MTNRHILWLLAALILPFAQGVEAQTIDELLEQFRGNRGAAIEHSAVGQALMPALSVIRQQYTVNREGQAYGKRGQRFYGETYTLAVKVPGYTIMQEGVLFPWEGDTDFAQLNRSGAPYQPVLAWSMQRALTDSIWQEVGLELGTPRTVSPIRADSLLFKHVDRFMDFGLLIDETPGQKQGFMVWAVSDTDTKDSAMHVCLSMMNMRIEARADSTCLAVQSDAPEKAIGGLFVVPRVERLGVIRLYVVGVASRKGESDWKLCLLTKPGNAPTPTDGTASGPSRSDEAEASGALDLTPVP